MKLGIYESLITEQLKQRLAELDRKQYFIADDKKLDSEEAVFYLSAHLIRTHKTDYQNKV